MELMDAIAARRSVRAYAPEALDRATLEKLIGAAIQAPTGMNVQPWAFGVIVGAEKLKGYGDRAKAALLASLDQMPALGHYRDMLSDPNYHLFYGAPAIVVIYAKPTSPIARVDCALAAENLMLAAADMGLGTCWIGFSEGFFSAPEVKAELGVPEEYQAVAPLIVGRPAGPVNPVPRNAPEILFWQS